MVFGSYIIGSSVSKGNIIAVSVSDALLSRVIDVLSSLILETNTLHSAVSPLLVVAVMTASPNEIAVTFPSSTFATLGLLEFHATTFTTSDGKMVVSSVSDSSFSRAK